MIIGENLIIGKEQLSTEQIKALARNPKLVYYHNYLCEQGISPKTVNFVCVIIKSIANKEKNGKYVGTKIKDILDKIDTIQVVAFINKTISERPHNNFGFLKHGLIAHITKGINLLDFKEE